MPAPLPLVHLARPPRQPVDKPPLLVLLHGRGSNEQDLFSFADMLDPRLYVVSPRAPETLGPDMYAWFPIDFTPRGPVADPAHVAASRSTLLRFIQGAIELAGTEAERTYLLGFSQGAMMALAITLTQPNAVAGAIALSGRLLPQARTEVAPPEALQGKPLFVGHGTHDGVVAIAEGRAAQAFLATVPVDLTYREYPIDHTISNEEFADVTAWLAARLPAT